MGSRRTGLSRPALLRLGDEDIFERPILSLRPGKTSPAGGATDQRDRRRVIAQVALALKQPSGGSSPV
jgi:hypothetical protein